MNELQEILNRRSRHYILQDGEVVDVPFMDWARWFETASLIIAHEEVCGKFFVSTVFLGIDHQYGPGPPLLFETMVFRLEDWNATGQNKGPSGSGYGPKFNVG